MNSKRLEFSCYKLSARKNEMLSVHNKKGMKLSLPEIMRYKYCFFNFILTRPTSSQFDTSPSEWGGSMHARV